MEEISPLADLMALAAIGLVAVIFVFTVIVPVAMGAVDRRNRP